MPAGVARPENKNRVFRCDDDEWLAFQEATAANYTTPSIELRNFIKDYNREHRRKAQETSKLSEANGL